MRRRSQSILARDYIHAANVLRDAPFEEVCLVPNFLAHRVRGVPNIDLFDLDSFCYELARRKWI
jgi:hypothetical protein